MRQIALPLSEAILRGPSRIIVGSANEAVLDAFEDTASWPFRTAVLTGPPRSGKSLLARWFVESGKGEAIDDAMRLEEAELFHRWNRAQQSGNALLLVGGSALLDWQIRLPDLASRIAAALPLEIGEPDDAMLAELIALHAELRGLVLDAHATAYLVPRCERSHLGVESLVAVIDRLSLERKQPPGPAIWRAALAELARQDQPRLP